MIASIFAAESQRGREVGEELFGFLVGIMRWQRRAIFVVYCDVIAHAVNFRVRRKRNFPRFKLLRFVVDVFRGNFQHRFADGVVFGGERGSGADTIRVVGVDVELLKSGILHGGGEGSGFHPANFAARLVSVVRVDEVHLFCRRNAPFAFIVFVCKKKLQLQILNVPI